MRVYGNCGTMPHTGSRPTPTPTLTGIKHPPKATALGADLLKAPGHIDHIGKKKPGPRAKTAPPRACAHCGTEFTRRDGERLNAHTARITCSRECATAYRTTNRRNAA